MRHSLKRVCKRFRDFGGLTLLKEYARIGILPRCCIELGSLIFCRKEPIEAYRKIMGIVDCQLKSKYQPLLDDLDNKYSKEIKPGALSNIVWVCWMQGIEKSPLLVRVCYDSLCQFLKGREIVLLDESNLHEYVVFPDYIEEKYRKGIITKALYTDLLRLELLINFGGTWIDSTVLCTGDTFPKALFDSDLFVYQRLEKGRSGFCGLSNWFITARKGHWVLMELRDMLYQYWRDYDCVVHYYIFHLFFSMIMEKHPEVASIIPKHGNRLPHLLSRRMGDRFDEEWMQELRKRTCFHKLSYRLSTGVEESSGSFYDVIIKNAINRYE